jgi:hypothetical protein
MGNKNKNGSKIRIVTDHPRNVEYTFIDDGSPKLNAPSDNGLSRESKRKEEKDISYSVRRHSELKSTTDSLGFKSSKLTKAQSKQNQSPVYE